MTCATPRWSAIYVLDILDQWNGPDAGFILRAPDLIVVVDVPRRKHQVVAQRLHRVAMQIGPLQQELGKRVILL
jgi:hypothetical protein